MRQEQPASFATRVALGICLLACFSCQPRRSEVPPEAVDAFFSALDRHVACDLDDVPLAEAYAHLQTLMKVGCVILGGDGSDLRVTCRFEDVPISIVLEDLCEQSDMAWCIAPRGGTSAKLIIGSPEQIAALAELYPVVAGTVGAYRKKAQAHLRDHRAAETGADRPSGD